MEIANISSNSWLRPWYITPHKEGLLSLSQVQNELHTLVYCIHRFLIRTALNPNKPTSTVHRRLIGTILRRHGILSAIAMRIGLIIAGVSLLESFHWMILYLEDCCCSGNNTLVLKYQIIRSCLLDFRIHVSLKLKN